MFSVKVLSITFLSSVIICIASFVGVVVYLDPYHIYYLPKSDHILFDGNARVQDASYIRFYDFDSFILGNSYMENTKASEAEEKLGGKFFNLSLSGSDDYERSIVLHDVFRRHNIKSAVLLLTDSLSTSGHGTYPVSEWEFLYDKNPLNDIKLYLNDRMINYFEGCLFNGECRWGGEKNMDRPCEWIIYADHASRFGDIANWGKYHQNNQLNWLVHHQLPDNLKISAGKYTQPSIETQNKIDAYLNDYVFSFVTEHPETTFYCYYCPASMLLRAFQSRDDSLSLFSMWLNRTVELGKKYPNFKLFGFDNLSFTSDMARYKDLTHFDDKVNSLILTKLQKNEDRLTEDNIDNYLKTLRSNAENFDISRINEIIQNAIPK